MRGVLAVVVGIGLLSAGCTSNKNSGPDTTVPTAAPTTATTSAPVAPDVSKVPAVIDEAYVNAVLATLDELEGQATRLIVSTKKLDAAAIDRLQAILDVNELRLELEVWLTDLTREPDLPGIFPNPGNRRTTVERIIAASLACIWIAVLRDYSRVNVDPGPDRTEYVALQPLDPRNNPKGLNPTAWMITSDGLRRDGTEPANPCPPS